MKEFGYKIDGVLTEMRAENKSLRNELTNQKWFIVTAATIIGIAFTIVFRFLK